MSDDLEKPCPLCMGPNDFEICHIHSIFEGAGPGWTLYRHEQQLHSSTRCALENALKRVSQLEMALAHIQQEPKP